MAVARLNRLKIVAYKSLKDELLRFLQEEGSVEIIDLSSRAGEGIYSVGHEMREGGPSRFAEFEKPREELAWLISFLGTWDKTKRYIVTEEEFRDIAGHFDHSTLYVKCRKIDSCVKELDDKKRALSLERASLEPWKGLGVDLADISKTAYTVRGLGIIKKESLELLRRASEEEGLDLACETVAGSGEDAYLLYIFLRQDEEKISGLFTRYALTCAHFPGYSKSPSLILEEIDLKVQELERTRETALAGIGELVQEKKKAFISYDHLSALNSKELALAKALRTDEVYLIEGWVRKQDAGKLKALLEARFSEIELSLGEPQPGDDVPVILENPRFLQPFEFITQIYGLPAYHEVDPTPFMAPFFFIFFGFCITDAAYGIILALVALLVMKRFRMGAMGTRFFGLLLYGGISTILLGAVTGGWFGDLIDVAASRDGACASAVKAFKDNLVLLDPMKDPMRLLIVALMLGVAQIWFGNLVAVYGNVKNKRYLDALLDQGSAFLFLFGFSGLILIFLRALTSSSGPLFGWASALGALAVIATQGRSNPTIGSKLFFGIYTLYNLFSGYLSDVLSYSRLWALGLVTGVMASTVNLIAILMGGMVPFVGVVVAAAILIGGHAVTLAMNLLGAFVHPTRLQFVEFFSKFFKGGGRQFRPLHMERRYTTVR